MRYLVTATVAYDAWAYVEATDLEEAREQASTLSPREFELGDLLDHVIWQVVRDA